MGAAGSLQVTCRSMAEGCEDAVHGFVRIVLARRSPLFRHFWEVSPPWRFAMVPVGINGARKRLDRCLLRRDQRKMTHIGCRSQPQ